MMLDCEQKQLTKPCLPLVLTDIAISESRIEDFKNRVCVQPKVIVTIINGYETIPIQFHCSQSDDSSKIHTHNIKSSNNIFGCSDDTFPCTIEGKKIKFDQIETTHLYINNFYCLRWAC